MASIADDCQDLSLCPICSKSYNHDAVVPIFLPCFDTMCFQCLNKLNTSSSNNTVACPKCYQTFNLSKETINKLPTNKYVLKAVELQNIIYNGHSWCVTCDAAPNSGCKTNQHIIADHENEKEEIEGLLGEISNNFKKAATSREEFQNKFLQQRVDHLEAKLKQAKSEKSQNSTCLNELKLCIANYVEKKLIPIERGDFAFGYGSTKKNLKKILQKAKKEASFSMGFLINQNNLENSAPSDEDIEEAQAAYSPREPNLTTEPIASTSDTSLPSEEEQSLSEVQMEDENVSIDGSNSDSPTTSNEATNKELLIETVPGAPATKNLGDNLVQTVADNDAAAALSTSRRSSARLSRFKYLNPSLRAAASLYNLMHECDNCERSYKRKDSLVRHKRNECGKSGAFKCSKCSFIAYYRHQLKKHVATTGHDE